jgi:hypothetical protein
MNNLKKIIFIIVCAEMMILYWAQLDVRESKRHIVYDKTDGDNDQARTQKEADTSTAPVEKAS